ncbi:MAG: RHS repeat-associated core domain-containing protein [Deltaproteobacteria bacterium]|nr:RHS repeat-associated core domain-containing protein [Deltaproteobacteria bacterium]
MDKNRPYAQVIEERDDGGALLASYIHGVDLISQHRGGHDYYYHTDEQGSVVTLSDENGAKAAQYYYTSYGELWNQGHSFADTNKYRYTGEQFDDETGFYYLRARYYDPGVGRFVTQDNCSGGLRCIDMRRPLSLNKYLYAEGNPMLYTDPSGHFTLMELKIVVASISISASVAIGIFYISNATEDAQSIIENAAGQLDDGNYPACFGKNRISKDSYDQLIGELERFNLAEAFVKWYQFGIPFNFSPVPDAEEIAQMPIETLKKAAEEEYDNAYKEYVRQRVLHIVQSVRIYWHELNRGEQLFWNSIARQFDIEGKIITKD